jgi:hypothetical protein
LRLASHPKPGRADSRGLIQRCQNAGCGSYLSADSAATETLDAVIDWGRYAEIFSYNDQTEIFSLEDVES